MENGLETDFAILQHKYEKCCELFLHYQALLNTKKQYFEQNKRCTHSVVITYQKNKDSILKQQCCLCCGITTNSPFYHETDFKNSNEIDVSSYIEKNNTIFLGPIPIDLIPLALRDYATKFNSDEFASVIISIQEHYEEIIDCFLKERREGKNQFGEKQFLKTIL